MYCEEGEADGFADFVEAQFNFHEVIINPVHWNLPLSIFLPPSTTHLFPSIKKTQCILSRLRPRVGSGPLHFRISPPPVLNMSLTCVTLASGYSTLRTVENSQNHHDTKRLKAVNDFWKLSLHLIIAKVLFEGYCYPVISKVFQRSCSPVSRYCWLISSAADGSGFGGNSQPHFN